MTFSSAHQMLTAVKRVVLTIETFNLPQDKKRRRMRAPRRKVNPLSKLRLTALVSKLGSESRKNLQAKEFLL